MKTAPSVSFDALRHAIRIVHRQPESEAVARLLRVAKGDDGERQRIAMRARTLVEQTRQSQSSSKFGGVEDFLSEFGLSTAEGVTLMCLAEALLRVPDAATADQLIRDKLAKTDWEQHLGQGDTLFVNASTWGLMLSGKVLQLDTPEKPGDVIRRLIARLGEPVIRTALQQSMRLMGRQFVMGRTIVEAIDRARGLEKKGYHYSYDMLGEGARTHEDAQNYADAYRQAIASIGKASQKRGTSPFDRPGISVKLSALYPRYEWAHRDHAVPAMSATLLDLAQQAKQYGICLCVDAEEATRLDISLDIIERVFTDSSLSGWDGFGLAVQAYQKRALPVIDWLVALARSCGNRMMVRLVKGAYWDSEIKWVQERGLEGYPVFTRKYHTDTSYLACARRMLASRDALYPQFATHNAQTLAAIVEMAGVDGTGYEFQRLHGMGDALYEALYDQPQRQAACRIYAPVGSHEDLLPYLVRRLLENGANTSFVNRLNDADLPVEKLIRDPLYQSEQSGGKPHSAIALPVDLFGMSRQNSSGPDTGDPQQMQDFLTALRQSSSFDNLQPTPVKDVAAAIATARQGFVAWRDQPVESRAACLDRFADLMQHRHAELIRLLALEAGKTIPDGIAELREAIDFCRYYAVQARSLQQAPLVMPGPTGESNYLSLHGRGVFVCISPWNFPLAIFVGQVAAALVSGNAVMAKPAEQTPKIAAAAIDLFHLAGVPPAILQLVVGDGAVGAALVADPGIAGVVFTGSTETAWRINQSLASKKGPILPLIAETGGQNCLIADSTALPEQVVDDVLNSAFRSAGQRCSALRVLYVQHEIADRVIDMLKGAAGLFSIGDPLDFATDIGPVIDGDALVMLEKHEQAMAKKAKLLFKVPVPSTLKGHYFGPCAFEIASIDVLEKEVFGPILHIIRFGANELNAVIESINSTGFGLTFGLHTRIEARARSIAHKINAGNIYINRNMIGAVVGVQPFGGEGLSGTGPKAGGPHYLYRFMTEKTITNNITAAGGNTSLITLRDDEI
jgi:RHH-type proline utilization regulon transcriptional repressor/proline dehydrogenase/delta 1-pyrroline-5-carboxylate dehydrogenase